MPNSIDFGFYKPDAWYDKAVILPDTSSSLSTAQTLYDHEFLYLSFAPTNYSDTTSGSFFVDVYFDGEFYRRVSLDGIQGGYYRSHEDMSVGSFTVGTHTVGLTLIPLEDEDPDLSDNIYTTTFTVTQDPSESYYAGYYGGDTYSLDCKVTLELDYGKYVLSGNFIGSETGKKVNAKFEIYDSRKKKIGTVNVKKGKVDYKQFTLAKGTYTVYVLSTDKQKSADRVTFNITGDVFYKSNLNDNSISDISGYYPYIVTVQDTPRTLIADGWVGFGDVLSCRQIDFTNAGRYNFTVNTSDQIKVSLISVTVDGKGRPKEKSVASVSVTGKKIGKNIDFGGVLLEEGTYYLRVEALNATKGTNADYTVKVNSQSKFYTDADDGRNDWLYDKDNGLNSDSNLFTKKITADTDDIYLDWYDVTPDGYDNFVGFGDAVDYARITLSGNASLSFFLTATDATKFSIISLTPKKGGKYATKELQKVTLKKEKGAAEFTAVTKTLALTAGQYYICMQSTNAAKGGEAFYNVKLNTADCSGLENLGASELSALDMPDELSFAQTAGTDVLSDAGCAASDLSELNGDPAWRDLASLA